ncbi:MULTISPECIES: L,D-transpeptidase family protein [unclassified Clostridium]|uniref:L,D-transpeptidase family protein n=1 Tax=unclassified Clostridium TaxID=2614128 RepID=UPI0025BDF158|nr:MULTISPECIES: L,D-transpeptidase family protein [unclassified Clostridium]
MNKKNLILILILTVIIIIPKNIFALSTENSNKSPYVIIIDLTTNKMQIFKNDVFLEEFSCSGGKSSTPSPIGTWKIVNKGIWGGGFGARWMGLNIPWGKYGIHGNKDEGSIGWNSSHGCIRMHNKDVAKIYGYIPIGTTVIIHDGPTRELKELRPGMIGSDVYKMQKILKEKGYFKGYLSGKYGEDFKHAVHNFQKDNGLKVNDFITPEFYNALGIYPFE